MHTRREALRFLTTSGVVLAASNFPSLRVPPASSELLIRGGRVVNADGMRIADVRVVGETIAEVATGLKAGAGARVIEAADKLVMPGGVDPHTHMSPGYGVDDIKVGSMAALAGGITTIGTFAGAEKNETAQHALDTWSGRVTSSAIVDVFLHAEAWPPANDVVAVMAAIASRGQPSCKVYFNDENFGAQAHNFLRLIEAARGAGVVTMAHCEDAAIVAAATRRLVAGGRTTFRDYGASRPAAAEISATAQAAAICESTSAPLYVVHLSCARALAACQPSRRAGAPLFVETRPLYLHLMEDRMTGLDAPLFVGQPPLRTSADREQLWRGLADGSIDVLGSDHAPFTRAQKMDPALSISKTLPGMSDLQFMLPMYFSEGVHKQRLPLTRFVATTSTNAARIFGMYPRKGVIRAGSDADIVIWDPNRTGTVTADADLSNADYSVYEGWKVTGWPMMIIRRGEIVCDAGRIIGQAGSGRLISRTPWKGMTTLLGVL